MPPNDQTDLLQLRAGFSKALDQMTLIGTDLSGASPTAETKAKAAQILRALGFASPNAQDEEPDDQPAAPAPKTDGDLLTPEQRRQKRDAKAFAGAFNGMEKTIKAKRGDVGGGFWPADLSPPLAEHPAIKGPRTRGR